MDGETDICERTSLEASLALWFRLAVTNGSSCRGKCFILFLEPLTAIISTPRFISARTRSEVGGMVFGHIWHSKKKKKFMKLSKSRIRDHLWTFIGVDAGWRFRNTIIGHNNISSHSTKVTVITNVFLSSEVWSCWTRPNHIIWHSVTA